MWLDHVALAAPLFPDTGPCLPLGDNPPDVAVPTKFYELSSLVSQFSGGTPGFGLQLPPAPWPVPSIYKTSKSQDGPSCVFINIP